MTWLQTYTGKKYRLLMPGPDDIDIEDIAHALSNICRFNGHCRRLYSVAQHSVIVSQFVQPQNALWGLLHDASEAYTGDIIRPLKMIPEVNNAFRNIEQATQYAIAEKFGLKYPCPADVGTIDQRLLVNESRDVMGGQTAGDWGISLSKLEVKIQPWRPEDAKMAFLERYKGLTG
jgi:hypothetical protein